MKEIQEKKKKLGSQNKWNKLVRCSKCNIIHKLDPGMFQSEPNTTDTQFLSYRVAHKHQVRLR